jgi:hypothetical protein
VQNEWWHPQLPPPLHLWNILRMLCML